MSRHMADGERHREEQAQWFGENVRANREYRQMSQGDVAREMTARGWQWHQSTVYKIEHGTRRTEAFEVLDLAEILSVPMAGLFWPPAEAAEIVAVDRALLTVRRAWREAAEAICKLLTARARAEITLAESRGSKYKRVRDARAGLEVELAETTADTAAREGVRRYEHPGEES